MEDENLNPSAGAQDGQSSGEDQPTNPTPTPPPTPAAPASEPVQSPASQDPVAPPTPAPESAAPAPAAAKPSEEMHKEAMGEMKNEFKDMKEKIDMPSKDEMKGIFSSALGVIKLNANTMSAVAKSPAATFNAYLIIIAVTVIGALGMWLFPPRFLGAVLRPSFMTLVWTAVYQVVMTFVGLHLLGYIAKSAFHSKESMFSMVRVLGYGMLVMVVGIIPQISIIPSIWTLAIGFVALRKVMKLKLEHAIFTILIAAVVMFVIGLILNLVGFTNLTAFDYGFNNFNSFRY